MPTPKVLSLKEIADLIGVKVHSMYTINGRAAYNRRKAEETGDKWHIRPGDLPAPDGKIGNSPYWNENTIQKWINERPGHGGGEHTRKAVENRAKREAAERDRIAQEIMNQHSK